MVASHGHDEERVLTAALREAVPYVGLIASTVRGEAVRESLDLPDELRAQLRTPAGLAIGAETPEEIALSILAEIVAARRSTAVDTREPRTVAAAAPPASAPVAIDPICGMEVAVSPASIQLVHEGERSTSAARAAATASPPSARRMPASAEPFVTGLVLAAGGSRRLGEPKQLLRYGPGTLLDHVLDTARASGFDQLVVALGGSVGARCGERSTSPARTSS